MMSGGLQRRIRAIAVMLAIFIAAGCAAQKKDIEEVPVVSGETGEAEEAVTEEASAAPQEEELSPAEARRIEEEELARKEREAEEAAVREFEAFMPADVYFVFDRSDLDSKARQTLAAIADWMDKLPSVKLRIEGHADERGTSEYNLALGDRRANSARRYLLQLGVGGERLSTISYGEEMPADAGHGEGAWEKNRRVHFEITSR